MRNGHVTSTFELTLELEGSQLMLDEDAVLVPQLADTPPVDHVELPRHAHKHDNTIAAMSAPGIFRPPPAVNEPILSYLPGSTERAELKERLEQMSSERVHVPMVIGGRRVETGTTFEAVMPHRRAHVLADVERGDASHIEQAITAARLAHEEWSRTPWHERVAVFLRAAELLSGPWRSTLNAATMLNQSKTAHQAEIDAACETIDFCASTPSTSRASTASSPSRLGACGTVSSTARSKASSSR